VNARTGALEWRYPPAPPSDNQPDDEVPPADALLLAANCAQLDYGTTLVREALYVCGADGRVYGLDASRGTLLGADTQDRSDDYISERLGGAIFSSPVFTYVRDTDEHGNVRGDYPAVVVATDFGLLLALHADDRTNARGGKAFEGWDLYGNAAFASPAVLDNWLYAADNDGVVYAYQHHGRRQRW
jgi:outer membrane protein assembly factor BamB